MKHLFENLSIGIFSDFLSEVVPMDYVRYLHCASFELLSVSYGEIYHLKDLALV